MALIIDAKTGTILDSSDCFVVHANELTEEQQAWLEGSDSDIARVAETAGVPLEPEAMEWIRYGRTTSVSYGPSALRDEADAILDVMGPASENEDPDDARIRGYLEWAKDEATDEELAYIAGHILEDDHAWDGYKENFKFSLAWYKEANEEPF